MRSGVLQSDYKHSYPTEPVLLDVRNDISIVPLYTAFNVIGYTFVVKNHKWRVVSALFLAHFH